MTFVPNIFYGTKLTDMETCYKLVPAYPMKQMNLKSNRFNIEPEITAKILKRGCRILEVPISYKGRKFSEGKKINWKDGISAVWALIKYRFIE